MEDSIRYIIKTILQSMLSAKTQILVCLLSLMAMAAQK
jgi:hypothetical protein